MRARWTACRLPPLKVLTEACAFKLNGALLLIPLFLGAGAQMAGGQWPDHSKANSIGPGAIVARGATANSGIALVSRLSDAQAYALGGGGVVNPPPQTQTDFLPASLVNSAMSYGEPGAADAHSASNSQITVNDLFGTLHVSGDGMANASVAVPGGSGFSSWASAKIIVISFDLTDRNYAYSLTGLLSAAEGPGTPEHPVAATAKLTKGKTTIFEVIADNSPVILSESGMIPPGNYILTVDVSASTFFSSVDTGRSSANFAFHLSPASHCSDDTWTATSTVDAPSGREVQTAVWAGYEMIVWGGRDPDDQYLNTGGRYDPSTDTWIATDVGGAPTGRYFHTGVWTGNEMIVWGGSNINGIMNTGGRYDPARDSWVATSTNGAPEARYNPTAVWTGSEMIVWGGVDGHGWAATGGRYDPRTNSWVATSTTSAPVGRADHTAVWTGNEMIVWGGESNIKGVLNSGGKYNPVTDSWVAINTSSAPTPRTNHTAVWTGSEMIIWGGYFYEGVSHNYLNTGAKYNPVTDSWTPISTVNAPTARSRHKAVWTGSEMIVWGGGLENTGGRYNPLTDTWTATSTSDAPSARAFHSAIWTGSEMIVWGGYGNTGGKYCAQPPTAAALGNISTRLRIETGDNVPIGGFIVTGTLSKRVIVRAIGPSLGLSGALIDPTLELRDSLGELIRSNDNWRSDQATEIIASGIPPGNDLESAIVETLTANGSAYTAIVRGAHNETGVGLVEVYDLDRTVDAKLVNISTRGLVLTGDNAMIAGTIVLGQASQRVLVRGIGPSLSIEDKLADPTLELHNANGTVIRANDNWRSDQETEIKATGIPPAEDLESALIETLPAGGAAYTAIVRGTNDTTGVALVEIYALTN